MTPEDLAVALDAAQEAGWELAEAQCYTPAGCYAAVRHPSSGYTVRFFPSGASLWFLDESMTLTLPNPAALCRPDAWRALASLWDDTR